MRLGDKQRIFTRNIAFLIEWAYKEGYELSFAEAYRTPAQAELNAKNGTGISTSLHISRLAVDLNLFKDKKYLRKTSDHEALGLFWESLHELNRWGGRFNDGNHYSMEHQGRK